MRAVRFTWKLFFGHVVLAAVVLGVCLWLVIAHFARHGDAEIAANDYSMIWRIGLIGLVGAISLALGLSILWSRRIHRLTASAHRLARGDLSAQINADGLDEVALLARSLERMRERLRRQLNTIEHQGRTLQSLLSQLHEGVVVSGPDGRIVLMNPAASHFLGLPADRSQSGSISPKASVEELIPDQDLRKMLLSGTDDDGRVLEKRLDLQSNDGVLSILARSWEIALPAATADGETLDSAERSVMGRLLVLTDITELTRAMQVRSDFVANASHELRTPISAIRAAVDTVLKIDVARDAEDAARFLRVIGRHTARLEALVGDLLDLSRLENPAASFQPSDLSLKPICEELYERWRSEIDAKQLRWRFDVADDCPKIFANAYLLQVVLDNLMENAIKFTDPGGKIGVGCRRQEESIEIEVFDTGCGIPHHELQRVFERFYQVEAARSSGELSTARPRGTGLGLSIVKHAVTAMGGSVRLDSIPNRGTKAIVTIPYPRRSLTQS